MYLLNLVIGRLKSLSGFASRVLFPSHDASLLPAIVSFQSLYKPLSMPVFAKHKKPDAAAAPAQAGAPPAQQPKVGKRSSRGPHVIWHGFFLSDCVPHCMTIGDCPRQGAEAAKGGKPEGKEGKKGGKPEGTAPPAQPPAGRRQASFPIPPLRS